MHLGLAALHPDGSCSNSEQKSRMAASDVIPDVRIERAWILDWQSGTACRADAFGKENGFLFLSQEGMRSSMLASIQEPFALSSSSGMNCSHLT